MKESSRGKALIGDLLLDPAGFESNGRAIELLEEYFNGLSLDTLRPLLRSDNALIRQTAAWIAAELGGKGDSLLPYVAPLVGDEDVHTRWYALEAIVVCARGEHVRYIQHLVRALADDDEAIRRLAMRLLARVEAARLKAGMRMFDAGDPVNKLHVEGLATLLGVEPSRSDRVLTMIESKHALERRYGVVAAARMREEAPDLIVKCLSSTDLEVRTFAEEVCSRPTVSGRVKADRGR